MKRKNWLSMRRSWNPAVEKRLRTLTEIIKFDNDSKSLLHGCNYFAA
jgi:hypothetical protein